MTKHSRGPSRQSRSIRPPRRTRASASSSSGSNGRSITRSGGTPEGSDRARDAADIHPGMGEGARGRSMERSTELLHSLGNLTLTKYNAEMSNKPYADKRKEFEGSNYVLNRHFAEFIAGLPSHSRRGQRSRRRADDLGRSRQALDLGGDGEAIRPTAGEIRFRNAHEIRHQLEGRIRQAGQDFDADNPGLLKQIARNRASMLIALDGDRFRRSRSKSVRHSSIPMPARPLQDWCRKVAKLAAIEFGDFDFIVPE